MGYDVRIVHGVLAETSDPVPAVLWDRLRGDNSMCVPEEDAAEATLVVDPDVILRYEYGEITVKNPPGREAIAALVRIAEKLEAVVVGDDAEVYWLDEAGELQWADPLATHPAETLPDWWRRHDAKRRGEPLSMPPGATEPNAGAVMHDTITGSTCHIVEVDPEAERGHGLVRVRFPDGSEAWRVRTDAMLEPQRRRSWWRSWRRT